MPMPAMPAGFAETGRLPPVLADAFTLGSGSGQRCSGRGGAHFVLEPFLASGALDPQGRDGPLANGACPRPNASQPPSARLTPHRTAGPTVWPAGNSPAAPMIQRSSTVPSSGARLPAERPENCPHERQAGRDVGIFCHVVVKLPPPASLLSGERQLSNFDARPPSPNMAFIRGNRVRSSHLRENGPLMLHAPRISSPGLATAARPLFLAVLTLVQEQRWRLEKKKKATWPGRLVLSAGTGSCRNVTVCI